MLLYCAYLLSFIGASFAETSDLYNTKAATSDLQWTTYPTYGGWEELSTLDLDGKTIRSYQVCNYNSEDTSSWVRTPYIPSQEARRAYIDVEFSMMECGELHTNCKETFDLYYFETDSDVASSTFPPWQENPFVKIDTIAAGERFSMSDNDKVGGVNQKTWTLGPLTRNGFYIAAHDQGACMSILSLRVYYYFCPQTVDNLARFPRTVAGDEVTSLNQVSGSCVENSNFSSTSLDGPSNYCNGNGEWKVRTGSCVCLPGHEADTKRTRCKACGRRKYKNSHGNHRCRQCPPQSISVVGLHNKSTQTQLDSNQRSDYCTCVPGYYRTSDENVHFPCSAPPSAPTFVNFEVNETAVLLLWKPPTTTGGRIDLYYNITCDQCDSSKLSRPFTCVPCPADVIFQPANHKRLLQERITASNLRPFTSYRFQILAMNGVSLQSDDEPAFTTALVVTKESTPSAVVGVQFSSISRNNLSLVWKKPRRANGLITGYQVSVKDITASAAAVSDEKTLRKTSFSLQTRKTSILIADLEPGHMYSVKVRSSTAVGYGPYSATTSSRTVLVGPADLYEETPTPVGWVTGICIAVAFVALSVVLFVYFSRNRCSERKSISEESSIDETAALNNSELIVRLPPVSNDHRTYVEYPDPHEAVHSFSCELNPNYLRIETIIGQGEFGEVFSGKLRLKTGRFVSVAIKRMKEGLTDQRAFLREASTMAQFSHPNVVELKGVVTESNPQMIVTEHMENGSLEEFLKEKRGHLSVIQLVQMLRGIASGMTYLSNMKYVHRDLAARNILVNSELVCKVSDFGLSRTLENDPHGTYTTQGGKIAIRWTAPECIRYRKFTSASDVWSYGIVMWEVMSYGEKPYWEMTNLEVMETIDEGYRLPAPFGCPVSLHRLMVECWALDANQRPRMETVCNRLENILNHPTSLSKVNLQVSTTPTTPCIDEARPVVPP